MSGCGCQPQNCAPQSSPAQADPVKEEVDLPDPTKVVSLICYDITSYQQKTYTTTKPRVKTRSIVKTRMKTMKHTDYVEETAVRYKMQKVIEIQKKKVPKTRMVDKWVTKTVPIPIPRVKGVKEDCCGNIASLSNNSCTCAPDMEFDTRQITKRVRVQEPETYYVDEDCEVEVMKRVPYNVTVHRPKITFKQVPEPYTVQEEYIEDKPEVVTKVIPIVTRQCKDAHGKIVTAIADVPLFASGPTEAQLNIDNLSESIVPTEDQLEKPEELPDDPIPNEADALRMMKAELNRKAQLVVAPLDDVNKEVGFIQVGGISNNGFMTIHKDAPVGRLEDLKDDCGLGTCKTGNGCVPCVDGSVNPAMPTAAGARGWSSGWSNLSQDGPAEVEDEDAGSSSAGWQLNP